MVLTRNKEHEKLMIVLYQYFFCREYKFDFNPVNSLENTYKTSYEEIPLFSREVAVKALLHIDEIVDLISKNLIDWKFDRLNNVLKAILVVAIAESQYGETVEKAITIDIAMNLAKRYIERDRCPLVNAVLDKVL